MTTYIHIKQVRVTTNLKLTYLYNVTKHYTNR